MFSLLSIRRPPGKPQQRKGAMATSFDPGLLQSLVNLLSQTLNPLSQKQAEDGINQLELCTSQFPLLLLAISDGRFGVLEVHIRMAAALLFKNFVKRYWPVETAIASLTEDDRASIKDQIVAVLTKVPLNIQKQLSEAVTIIASIDFPDAWPLLIKQLVECLNPADFDNNSSILRTLHRMFKRYRTEFRSDELYTEINFVLGQLAHPLLEMYGAVDQLVQASGGSSASLEKLYRMQVYMNKIFYSLSTQDLPAFFEDHLIEFMGFLKKQLLYRKSPIDDYTDGEAGPGEKLPASVAKIAILYATRYEEDFPMLSDFVQAAWSLLVEIPRAPKYDTATGACMRLLSAVAKQERHKNIFAGFLQVLCDKVIVPNVLIREADLELFEDEPIEYIRREIEGVTDENGRRDGAVALARGLMEFYEAEVTAIILTYVEEFLKIYAVSPAQKWRDKNAAVRLFSAIAVKGTVSSLGVTRVNALVNIKDFFLSNIFPDLQPANAALHPLLKVDAIKFLFDFRSHLEKEQLLAAFPLIRHHLASHNYVVHTYAAIAIDRILSLKRQSVPVFTSADIAPFADGMVTLLFKIIQGKKVAERMAENEFLIQAILKILLVAQRQTLFPIMDEPLEHISLLICVISKNPSNPVFTHCLFECAAAIIRFCGSSPPGAQQIEAKLLPAMQTILQGNISELIHYVFQLFSVMIESREAPGLSPSIQALIAPVLQPTLWANSENIPALTRFLQACTTKDPSYIAQGNFLPQLFGIFQTLVGSKAHEIHAFALVSTIVQAYPIAQLEDYLQGVVIVALKRLQSNKSPRLSINFLLFLSIIMVAASIPQPASYLVKLFDTLQPKLLAVVMGNVLLTQAPKILEKHDRKLAVLGLTKMAAECPELLQGDPEYTSLFISLVSTITLMLTTVPAGDLVETSSAAEELQNDEGSEEVAGSFWKLRVAPLPKKCPAVDQMPEPTAIFANSLSALSRSQAPGKIAALLAGMDPAIANTLSVLLQQCNVSI